MKEYKAINAADPRVSLPEVWCVIRTSDNKPIFCDLDDPDTQAYLAWMDAGNAPEIVDPMEMMRPMGMPQPE